MTPFAAAVTEVVAALGHGQVVTYGEVAEEAGYPGAARGVGSALAASQGLPWWRVVTATGRLVPHLEAEHARRLRAEGIILTDGRVARRHLGAEPLVRSSYRAGRQADGGNRRSGGPARPLTAIAEDFGEVTGAVERELGGGASA